VVGVTTLAASVSPESVRSALSRLLTMLAAAAAFVFGILLPDLRGAESFGSAWLAVAGLLSVVVLPLLAFGTAVGAVHRLLDRRSDSLRARRLDACIVAVAGMSLLLYFSPWGASAVRWSVWALD
jgi:hypothetical protein